MEDSKLPARAVFISPKGAPITDSRIVAEVFSKRHDNVVMAIRNLNCTRDFRLLNFKECEEKQAHSTGSVKRVFVVMTKRGFRRLVFGFTGEKAALISEDFLEKF